MDIFGYAAREPPHRTIRRLAPLACQQVVDPRQRQPLALRPRSVFHQHRVEPDKVRAQPGMGLLHTHIGEAGLARA